jgi:hypothetical protein
MPVLSPLRFNLRNVFTVSAYSTVSLDITSLAFSRNKLRKRFTKTSFLLFVSWINALSSGNPAVFYTFIVTPGKIQLAEGVIET